MHFRFFLTLGKDFELEIIENARLGLTNAGHFFDVCWAEQWLTRQCVESDIAVFWGVNGTTRRIVDIYRSAGKRTLIFDKGAIRTRNRSDYNKVFLDGGTALAYLMRVDRMPDRWEKLGISLRPFKKSNGHIIYANNSQKVHDYWRLGFADELSETIIGKLKRIAPTREVVFRPKPRALDFREIEGVRLSLRPDTIEDALEGAHCLVTYTSHCSINALIAGVPVICLGPNPGRPLAGKYLEQVLQPHIPDDVERWQFFCNLAYAQWTDDEIRNGSAWEFILTEIKKTLSQDCEPLKPSKVSK